MPPCLARFLGRPEGDAARFLEAPPAFLATSLTRFLGTTGTESESSESESELSESDSLSDSYFSESDPAVS